jgi:hypothetical protein
VVANLALLLHLVCPEPKLIMIMVKLTVPTRTGGSLGGLTENVSTSSVRQETGGLGSPVYDDEKRQDK